MKPKKEKDYQSEGTLKRSDVVKKIHHETGMSSPESAELMNRVFEHISEALVKGEDVKLAGFGTFKLRQKDARLGRNPKTGEECTIAPRKVVTFKPSVAMRERVEGSLACDTADQSKVPSKLQRKEPLGSSRGFPSVKRREWIALFELLGSFAFAVPSSKKIKAEAFIQSVLEIKTLVDPKSAVTTKSVSSWVMLNQNRWATWKENETLIPRFKSNLSTLEKLSHKPDIIFAMVNIAIAENDYSDLERSLIAHAIISWDMPANVISDLEYVCPDIIPDLQEIS